MRRISREIKVGSIIIGGNNHVAVQSMLNAPIDDIKANVLQAQMLEKCGCEIIRVTVPTPSDARVVSALKENISVPIVADIHFDYKAALAALDAGADKIRINPGNIGDDSKVKIVVDACKLKNAPIRIGVNGGSLEKNILQKYGAVTPEALCESAMYHIALLEKHDFHNTIISIKASHVPTMIKAYKLLASKCDYPLHLGVTEAGTYRMGLIKSAMGIGSLLVDGIGDTIRVSLTDAPEKEVQAGYDVLRAAGHEVEGVEIISCPTCGRTCIDIVGIANEIEQRLIGVKKHIKIAVMGCVVNGPGEAKDADIGIAGGKNEALLFVKGEKVRMLSGDIIGQLIEEVYKL